MDFLLDYRFWILAYLLLINLVGFALMGIDKSKAIRHKWRIPEKMLFLSAILGGSVGARIGMSVFRHKTKHKSFTIGIPVIFLVELATGVFLILKFSGLSN
ncbi:DUF1294 domain-containing protein [Diplocloster agilis]|uniref:DUF1294 domain-containing protein n=1 Tax=Diplocloster agilis TaxID=2850323 RepID=UPI000822BE55|nr:DUF1294 domain-containing protein [Suonthocola fibrivorans]MCU6733612.1 DUF1294 domain-containing protein [Suonthocola fibrivorans]SCJ00044.1 Protein of uncharacterised function (DUF1294) [uncultured Clostridium sp.]